MFRRTSVELFSIAILPLGIGLAIQGSSAAVATDASPEPVAQAGPVSYARQVAPIFQASCAECHGVETTELELDLTTYEAVMKGSEYGSVIEAGDPDSSLLFEMVVAGEMPQEADPLTEEEIAVLRTWIAEGAQNN